MSLTLLLKNPIFYPLKIFCSNCPTVGAKFHLLSCIRLYRFLCLYAKINITIDVYFFIKASITFTLQKRGRAQQCLGGKQFQPVYSVVDWISLHANKVKRAYMSYFSTYFSMKLTCFKTKSFLTSASELILFATALLKEKKSVYESFFKVPLFFFNGIKFEKKKVFRI